MIVENKSLLSFPVTFESVEDIADGRFTKVKIYMMHTGLNYNKTVFEKDVVENAIPTLEYIPIVGFIKENQITGEKDFCGHEYIITTKMVLNESILGMVMGLLNHLMIIMLILKKEYVMMVLKENFYV